MCDCDLNIYNIIETESTYSALSLGTGQVVYAGDNIVADNTEFQFKSLVAGTDISIVSDADEITINNTLVETNTVTNLGGGSEVLVDVLAGSVRGRTLVGTGIATVTQGANTITIDVSNVVTTTFQQVYYNYMSPITVNFATNYQTGLILSSTVVEIPNPQTEGVLTILTSTAFIFTPAPRLTASVILPVNLLFSNGRVASLLIKMSPRLTWANDTTRDLLVGAATDGAIYQIDMLNSTTRPLLNYDGTTITSVIGATTQCVAMNQLDNILFYTQTGTPTTIRYYDLVTKLFGSITNYASTSGWTPGSAISSMTFDQRDSVLYVMGDLNAAVIRVIHIPPYDRSVGYVFATSPSYASVFPSSAGNIQQSICIDRNSKSIYGVCRPSAVDTTWRTTLKIGGVATTSYSLTLTGNTSAHCEIGPSGLAYCVSDTDLQWRKTQATRNTNNTTATFISPVTFYDLTVSYYGNLS